MRRIVDAEIGRLWQAIEELSLEILSLKNEIQKIKKQR